MAKYGSRWLPPLVKKFLLSAAKKSGLEKSEAKNFRKIAATCISRPTWKKYASVLKLYRGFCKKHAPGFGWPATEQSLHGFIIWCHCTKNLSATTIQSYVSALATLHSLSNSENLWPANKTTQLMLRGLKNRSIGRPVKGKPDPLTFDVLSELGERIRKRKWPALSKITVWTCCVVGYFGAFRAGEILAKNAHSFDKNSDLLWSDIQFDPDGGASITVRAPKARRYRPQKIRFLPIRNGHFCPTNCLQTLKTAQQAQGIFAESQPVFRFGSGKALTVKKFSSTISRLLRHSQFKTGRYSARSLRAGLPTDMEADPENFTDAHIKNWGRWRSRAYESYMRADQIQKDWLFKHIISALTKKFNF